ncbi:hypothetical protein NFI96_003380 [Prochilodus magdalenae]|nr:hypothetical protein NFI96_003380 [Prochilodus magdalenae]
MALYTQAYSVTIISEVVERYTAGLMDDALCRGEDLQSNRPLQALVAGLKAYSTWANVACLQECRECTGGMGFMMENRIPSLKCDSDVFVTFEGDNMVMLQHHITHQQLQISTRYKTKLAQYSQHGHHGRGWEDAGEDAVGGRE